MTAVTITRPAAAGRCIAWPATAPLAAAVLVAVAVAARFSAIGADARWLAALGRVIAHTHSVPSSVPFAAAPSAHFPNVLGLAELIFYSLERAMGDRGLMLAQLAAVATGMAVLARDARATGARGGGIAVALAIATAGTLPALAIVRVQLFSLALFPVLLALLRSEARKPSRRVWLLVPLITLWANLHGGVLIGLAVALCYLALSRFRTNPWTAVLVGAISVLALCLTPALTGAFDYYHRGLTNVSVERGYGLWAPLSLTSFFDIALVLAALVLMLGLRRARPPAWELVAVAVLAFATVQGSRNGVWLIFVLVAIGARAFAFKRRWKALALPVGAVALASIVLAVASGPIQSGASSAMVTRAVALAHGTPVLAPDIEAEEIALAGGRVWLSNPLEAFSRRYQAGYVDWLQGRSSGRQALARPVKVVLVERGSDSARLMERTPSFETAFTDGKAVLYVRNASG